MKKKITEIKTKGKTIGISFEGKAKRYKSGQATTMESDEFNLKQMEQVFKDAQRYNNGDDIVIKWWQTVPLWILWFFTGRKVISEGFVTYLVHFKGIIYMLKMEEI